LEEEEEEFRRRRRRRKRSPASANMRLSHYCEAVVGDRGL